MIVSREWVDIVAPKHGRTTCDDNNTQNGYGGWTGKYNEDTGEKCIRYPRCARCFLLKNIGADTSELDFNVIVRVELVY